MRNGLTNKEVIEQRKKYGSNEITRQKQKSILKLFLESLGDPIIKILLIALGMKTVFLFHDFDWFETLGIVIAILIASLISTLSEYGSEEAFKRLQEESSKLKCKVKRENKITEIPIDEVVVKDLVLLQTGDKIPADGIIKEGSVLVDESSMNGEAKEVEKRLGEKLYRGTVIYAEEAYMEVTEVGDKTFYGKMSKELQETGQESPLKIRLRELAKFISKIGYVSAVLVAISYLFTEIIIANSFNLDKILKTITNVPVLMNHLIYALTLSVTIIVVAVPEGLPMMITLVLSSNMKKMLKSNVLVRKMVGIETAGSLNILFTDKTGTLTKGKLEVVGFQDATGTEYQTEQEVEIHKFLHEHLKNNCLYNNGSYLDQKQQAIGGNTTDRAILEFIKSDKRKKYHKLKTIPFDSKNKFSGAIIDIGEKINYIKGSPEKLLPLCKNFVAKSGRKEKLLNKGILEQEIKKKTREGIRAILLAYNDNYNLERLERLTLIGVLYIKDDVRKEARSGVELVQNAGIQTVMITGDNKDTAISIGKEVGLITNREDIVLTSDELNRLSDNEVKKILPRLKIVARSMPQDKSRLVRLAEEENLVVGMTGDGVNDAPALNTADIGIAMGKNGTDVAKDAADMLLLDDNFSTIEVAIKEGRRIYRNIQKVIQFLLTGNIAEVLTIFLAMVFNLQAPILAVHILFVNLITDTLPALALGVDPANKNTMKHPPTKKGTLFEKSMIYNIAYYGALLTLLSFSAYFTGLQTSYETAITMTFTTLCLSQIVHAMNQHSNTLSFFSKDQPKNKMLFLAMLASVLMLMIIVCVPVLRDFFSIVPLTLKQWLVAIGLSLMPLVVSEILKLFAPKEEK